MRHRYGDLVITAGLALAAALAALAGMSTPVVRLPLAVLLIFILPGYALTSALFAHGLEIRERLLFTLGLSLAAVVLTGIVLNLTPLGLETASWGLALGGTTVAACLFAIIRRRGEAAIETSPLRLNLRLDYGFLLLLALLAIGASIGFSRVGALRLEKTDLAQLWLLRVAESNAQKVRLGVTSLQPVAVSYRLELAGDGELHVWPLIMLAPGQTWEATVTPAAGEQPLTATLYRSDAPGVIYRQVELQRGNGTPKGTN